MTHEVCNSGVPHVMDPDNHFCCKMRYMRANGGLNVSVPAGWGGPSWMSQERGVIAEAEANGYEPQRVR